MLPAPRSPARNPIRPAAAIVDLEDTERERQRLVADIEKVIGRKLATPARADGVHPIDLPDDGGSFDWRPEGETAELQAGAERTEGIPDATLRWLGKARRERRWARVQGAFAWVTAATVGALVLLAAAAVLTSAGAGAIGRLTDAMRSLVS